MRNPKQPNAAVARAVIEARKSARPAFESLATEKQSERRKFESTSKTRNEVKSL